MRNNFFNKNNKCEVNKRFAQYQNNETKKKLIILIFLNKNIKINIKIKYENLYSKNYNCDCNTQSGTILHKNCTCQLNFF